MTMRNKIIKITACSFLVILMLISTLPVSAETEKAHNIINDILDYKMSKCGVSSVQQLINTSLSQNLGSGSEWYVIALSQYSRYDFSAYKKALTEYLDKNEVYSASSRQKYALALISTGSTDEYIYNTLNDSIGQQGIMSWIFGLHMLNNGYTSNEYSLSDVKQKLLSFQLSDGGWAVRGSTGDVDVTAMTIQALAPYYRNDSAVKNAVDNALNLLSERQMSSGDYSSYGVNNLESTAQVLSALSSLGIDCKTDSRFIKNGNTLFDIISRYQFSDGSFSHKQGSGFNETATAQALCSMISYVRMQNSEGNLYIMDDRNPSGFKTPSQNSVKTEGKSDSNNITITDNSSQPYNNISYKMWVCIVLIVISTSVCVVLYLAKKRNKQNFILIAGITIVLIFFVFITDFQTNESYYNKKASIHDNAVGSVTLSIRCDTIIDKSESKYIPDDGIILDTTEISIQKYDTVYDVLAKAVSDNKLHLETSGGKDSIYVEGINYIYEFDYGDLSGWIYFVNGEKSTVGCAEYEISDGDNIEWVYSCELGEDIL